MFVRAIESQGSLSSRWSLLALFAPSAEALPTLVDIATQKRDAIVTVIALHRFHRQHGAWPNSLAALVPNFLSEVPLDQFDGNPLRYRVDQGQPFLYSVGANGVDEQGQPPRDGYEPPHTNDGDWRLWPPIPASSSQVSLTTQVDE